MMKSINIDLITKFHEAAKNRGINWTLERRQAGKLLWSQAWIRNQTGDERDLHVQIEIDDEANIAYVYFLANAAEAHSDLRDKLTDQNGIAEFNPATFGMKDNDKIKCYMLNDKCRFVSNGNIDVWIDEILSHVNDCLNIMSHVVY